MKMCFRGEIEYASSIVGKTAFLSGIVYRSATKDITVSKASWPHLRKAHLLHSGYTKCWLLVSKRYFLIASASKAKKRTIILFKLSFRDLDVDVFKLNYFPDRFNAELLKENFQELSRNFKDFREVFLKVLIISRTLWRQR